jgi:hypothetical protein
MGDDDRTTDRSLLNDLDLVENKQNYANNGRIANAAVNNALRDSGIPEQALGYKPGSGVEYSQGGVNLTQRIKDEQSKPDFEARAEKQRVVLQEKEKELARARLVAQNVTIPEAPAATVQPAVVAPVPAVPTVQPAVAAPPAVVSPSKNTRDDLEFTRGDLERLSKELAEKSKVEVPPAAVAPPVPAVPEVNLQSLPTMNQLLSGDVKLPVASAPTVAPSPAAASPAVSPEVARLVAANETIPEAPIAPATVAPQRETPAGLQSINPIFANSPFLSTTGFMTAPAVQQAQTARQTQTAQRMAKIESLNPSQEDQAKYNYF